MRRLLLLALFLAGCLEPTNIRSPSSWADSAFGVDAVDWVNEEVGGGETMIPALDETRVYFGQSGSLLALDRTTGILRWKAPIIFARNAAITDGAIGAVWGGLPVFDRSNGALKYTYRYPDEMSLSSNIATDGERYFVLTWHGRAVALDAGSGAVLWDTNLAGGPGTSGFGVEVVNGTVVATLRHLRTSPAGADTGIVAALDATTGVIRWRVVIDPKTWNESSVFEPAVHWNGIVVVTTRLHDIIAYDILTGAVRWDFDAAYGDPLMVSRGLAVCDGRIIAATGDLGIVAIDAMTGAVLWKIPDVGAGSLRGLECSHGTVLVSSIPAVRDVATGDLLSSYPIQEFFGTMPNVWVANATRDSDWLYVSTSRGFARVRAP